MTRCYFASKLKYDLGILSYFFFCIHKFVHKQCQQRCNLSTLETLVGININFFVCILLQRQLMLRRNVKSHPLPECKIPNYKQEPLKLGYSNYCNSIQFESYKAWVTIIPKSTPLSVKKAWKRSLLYVMWSQLQTYRTYIYTSNLCHAILTRLVTYS